MGLHDYTFYDLINRNAISFCDRPAWFEVDDERTPTFSEIKEQVDRLAGGLQKLGVEKGDRIGAVGKNSLEFFLLYGAAAALGAIVVPINWRLSVEEAHFNLNDCEPKILFVDADFQEITHDHKAKLPSVEHFFNLKPADGEFAEFDTLLDNSGEFDAADVASDDGLVIIHTAAVAGRPRGALLTHGNVIAANVSLNLLFKLSVDDVHLNLLPLFHVAGLFMATGNFHAGVVSVNMSKFDAVQAVDLIAEKKVTVLYDFSPILGSILDAHEKSDKDITSLKTVKGIENPETIERYQEVTGGTFFCVYGQTETSAMATMGRYDDRPGSAGQILELADVRLVDDNDNSVGTGEIGEIAVKGPMVFKGYWNLPEDTAYTFRGGWHHTGDLGRFDEDGFLWYEGRKAEKELIKPGGENVYPAEVERAILEHPAVEQTVVFGVPDPTWKEAIKAVCILKEGQELDHRELSAYVSQHIASYKKPSYVDFVDEFPLLEDGSPDRAKIKQLYGGPQE
ncbi:MAG: AMP-binding protein [Desulfobacterales bacterium]|jgi:long-chain acyl-CoA synthetase